MVHRTYPLALTRQPPGPPWRTSKFARVNGNPDPRFRCTKDWKFSRLERSGPVNRIDWTVASAAADMAPVRRIRTTSADPAAMAAYRATSSAAVQTRARIVMLPRRSDGENFLQGGIALLRGGDRHRSDHRQFERCRQTHDGHESGRFREQRHSIGIDPGVR